MSNLIGQTLGPYRIIEQIGIGGMATVYKAYQPSMDRYVAIKVLPALVSRDPAFLKRFRREAKVVAKLEHKHILPVHDYGEQEGLTYLVMRYVEAGTLKDQLAAGQLDLPTIYRFIAQVGSALDYAHRLGVIHRDVKPSNVLIDSQGDAYLTDFGLARIMESSEQLTATGVGVGTPAYMAPEQGQGLKIDHRSDIYSLGVMLYEMVTGRVPYQAETPMAVVLKHIIEPLPLPRQIVPDLPEEVERVILKALAKSPEDRFQTVREMVEALDLAMRAATAAQVEREVAPPVSAAPARKFRWPWDVRTTALGVGIAALALLVIGGMFFALSRIQYRVQVVGGRVEVVPVSTEAVTLTPAVALAATVTPVLEPTATATPAAGGEVVPAATPTAVVEMPTPTLVAVADATPTLTPTHTPRPMPTPTSSAPSPGVTALRWERVYDGAIFRQADVSALAVDSQNPNIIYAATSAGLDIGGGAGIYKSSDEGEMWVLSSNGLDHALVSGLLIDPEDSQTIYATTFGAGPYKSTDGGANWRPINYGLTQLTGTWNGVSSLAFDPADHLRLYHIDPLAGVFLSTDGGETWQYINRPCQMFISLVVDPRDGEHLFAGAFFVYNDPNNTCPGGLYESTDGGENWTPIAQDITGIEKAAVWRVTIDPHAPDSLYASAEYPGTGQPSLLIASSDGGENWNVLRKAGWRPAIAVNPTDSLNVYVGWESELYRSDDGGRTWVALRGGFDGNIEALAFNPSDTDTLYVGAAGVYRTSSGGRSWQSAKSGFGSTWLELAFDPSGGMLYAEDNDCNLYRSQDGGVTWEYLRSPGCGLAFDRQNAWLYREDWNTLYRSNDGGRTWASAGDSPPGGDNYRVYVSPQDGNVLYSLHSCCPPGPFIHRSTDGGQTWEVLQTASDLYHGRIAIADDGLRMYAASPYAVDISDDGGLSWHACQATTDNNGNPPALALHPQDSNTLLLGTWGAGVLKTINGCDSWATVNAGLENIYVNALAFDLRSPNTVYAGSDGGTFLSLDGGDSWSAINDGPGPNPVVYSIAVNPNDPSKVYAATPDGVFRLVGAPSEAATTPTPTPSLTNTATPTPTSTATPRPIGEVDTGMGGSLSIQGVVRDSFGNAVPNVYVHLSVYGEGGGADEGRYGRWDLYTDEAGSYLFNNLLRLDRGSYEVWFNGRHQYGKSYESSGYYIYPHEISGDMYLLNVTVHPVTGSAFSGVIQYEDLDGSVKNFYSHPFGRWHFFGLHRGVPGNREYAIGAEYSIIAGSTTKWVGLAGGAYYLEFVFRRLDGVVVECASPSFEIPPGETKQFEYTIRECPPKPGLLFP